MTFRDTRKKLDNGPKKGIYIHIYFWAIYLHEFEIIGTILSMYDRASFNF
jgi:hypothetical protein